MTRRGAAGEAQAMDASDTRPRTLDPSSSHLPRAPNALFVPNHHQLTLLEQPSSTLANITTTTSTHHDYDYLRTT